MSDPHHEPDSAQEACREDWPGLSTVQRWFQAVITHPDGVEGGVESPEASELVPLTRDELEVMVTRSERVSARDRIAIYANAYYARLLECLGEAYPVLKRTLGEEVFNGFAFGYLQRYPSSSYTLGRLGEHFAEYLQETRPRETGTDGHPGVHAQPDWPDFLVDLAHLEWTIAEVFDGPGLEGKSTLRQADMESLAPEDWPAVRIKTAPCLRLLQTEFPLNDYYTAVRDAAEEQQPGIPQPRPTYIAVIRRDYIVRRHDLTRFQFALLKALQDGEPLGEAVESAMKSADGSANALGVELRESFQDWTRFDFFENVAQS